MSSEQSESQLDLLKTVDNSPCTECKCHKLTPEEIFDKLPTSMGGLSPIMIEKGIENKIKPPRYLAIDCKECWQKHDSRPEGPNIVWETHVTSDIGVVLHDRAEIQLKLAPPLERAETEPSPPDPGHPSESSTPPGYT